MIYKLMNFIAHVWVIDKLFVLSRWFSGKRDTWPYCVINLENLLK